MHQERSSATVNYQQLRDQVISDGLESIPRDLWKLSLPSGESLAYVALAYHSSSMTSSKEKMWNLLKEYGSLGESTPYCVAAYLAKKFPSTLSQLLNEQDPIARPIMKLRSNRYFVACYLGRAIFDNDFLFLGIIEDGNVKYPMLDLCARNGRLDIGKDRLETCIKLAKTSNSARNFLIEYYKETDETPPKSIYKFPTVLEELILARKLKLNPNDPNDLDILLKNDKLARLQAFTGYAFEDERILKKAGVASDLIKYYASKQKIFIPKLSPRDMSDLRIINTYIDAKLFNQDIAKIIDQLEFSDRVDYAKAYALQGIKITDDYEILSQPREDEKYQLTVAHILANRGIPISDPRLLVMKDPWCLNRTIAHTLASFGIKTTDDPEILSIPDDNGDTVAHILASRGFNFSTEIMQLKNNGGISVSDIYEQAVIECMRNAIL